MSANTPDSPPAAAGSANTPTPRPPSRASKEVLVAAGCGVIATVICVWMVVRPATAEPRVAQYFVCITVGLYLSLFFYILWPQPDLAAAVPVPWYSEQPVRVVGPIVLFGLSTGLLFHFMPAREQFGKVYLLEGSPHPIRYSSETALEFRGRPDHLTCYLIPGEGDRSDLLKAVFVQFPAGEDSIDVVFRHYSYDDLPLTLRRTDPTLRLDGLRKKPKLED
jgi:hypothetical protein